MQSILIRRGRLSKMFRQPKALKEINKIQEAIYHEEKKMSSRERVAKIHREAEALRKRIAVSGKYSVTQN